MTRLTIVYDNDSHRPDLRADWGFSCLIETPTNRVLFDTGTDGAILLANMAALGLDPVTIDTIALSHQHQDHTGGLQRLLSHTQEVEIFAPAAFSTDWKARLAREPRVRFKAVSGPCALAGGLMSTGELGTGITEQSLIVPTAKGGLVVTGCAHPGLGAILAAARGQVHGPLFGVLGGFHGFADFARLETEALALLVPCHCTVHKTALRARFPSSCQIGEAGLVLELEE